MAHTPDTDQGEPGETDQWDADYRDRNRSGREVIQAYVSPPETAADRPEEELGASQPVQLAADEIRRVSLRKQALARYDERAGWTIDPGEYEVTVGRSSRDGRVTERLVIDGPSSG